MKRKRIIIGSCIILAMSICVCASAATKEADPLKAHYTSAQAAYDKLKGLEEAQDWNTYFNLKDGLQATIDSELEKALALARKDLKNPYGVEAAYLSWKAREQDSELSRQTALQNLLQQLRDFSAAGEEPELLRQIAERLNAAELPQYAAQVYQLYAGNLQRVVSPQELLVRADNNFNEGNTALAQGLYNAYLSVAPTESDSDYFNAVRSIIVKFADDGWGRKTNDGEFAESLFNKIDVSHFKQLFNADLAYLRAYNLEQLKYFREAATRFGDFLTAFPDSPRQSEAMLHMAFLYLYMLDQPEKALTLLEGLAAAKQPSAFSLESLVHLGLYWHYMKDIEKAKHYYSLLKEQIIQVGTAEEYLTAFVEARTAEIDGQLDLDFAIRNFFDAALANAATGPNEYKGKIKLQSAPGKMVKGSAAKIDVQSFVENIGCFQPDVRFLWWGHLNEEPSSDVNTVTVQYPTSGPKVVFVSAFSGSQLLDRDIAIIDVYEAQ